MKGILGVGTLQDRARSVYEPALRAAVRSERVVTARSFRRRLRERPLSVCWGCAHLMSSSSVP